MLCMIWNTAENEANTKLRPQVKIPIIICHLYNNQIIVIGRTCSHQRTAFMKKLLDNLGTLISCSNGGDLVTLNHKGGIKHCKTDDFLYITLFPVLWEGGQFKKGDSHGKFI